MRVGHDRLSRCCTAKCGAACFEVRRGLRCLHYIRHEPAQADMRMARADTRCSANRSAPAPNVPKTAGRTRCIGWRSRYAGIVRRTRTVLRSSQALASGVRATCEMRYGRCAVQRYWVEHLRSLPHAGTWMGAVSADQSGLVSLHCLGAAGRMFAALRAWRVDDVGRRSQSLHRILGVLTSCVAKCDGWVVRSFASPEVTTEGGVADAGVRRKR